MTLDGLVRPEETGGLERPRIDLERSGTPEAQWTDALDSTPTISADALAGGAPSSRLVVIAPHPDDETFGVGGLIAEWSASGRSTTILSLTDGEAAPVPDGGVDDPALLAARRRGELDRAVSRLAISGRIDVVRAALADGALADRMAEVELFIALHTEADDVVVAPLDCDGHPDHEAAGVAARRGATGRRTLWYPVWAWHWHEPWRSPAVTSSVRVRIGEDARRHRRFAAAAYSSQITGADPVVPAEMLRRFDRPFDVLVGPHDCGSYRTTTVKEAVVSGTTARGAVHPAR